MGTAFWLDGMMAPVPDEIDAENLPVTGALPAELDGRYFRNGPNPRPGEVPGHWFSGAGMLHGVRLKGGRAEWYRNRWVRTRWFTDDAQFLNEEFEIDRTAVTANTHVVPFDGKIYALNEVGFPYEVTPELDTVGPCDFGGRLTGAMTAHPKQDPVTGELLFFGYGFEPPYVTFHRLSVDGKLVESRGVDVPGPTMMHDFAITRNHVVWLDLPVVFDLAMADGLPFRWDDAYGARLGVMPRDGDEVRWFDVEPGYVFHVGNAHEDARGRVLIDGVRYDPETFRRIWSTIGEPGTVEDAVRVAAGEQAGLLHRWTLDPATGKAAEEVLDDRTVEFPTHDGTRTGGQHRFLYAVTGDAVVKYDLRTGTQDEHALNPGLVPGEAAFVPADDRTGEDEGWLLSIVSDTACEGSELLVLDASDLSRVASVRLPRRVPSGFHGSWIPDP